MKNLFITALILVSSSVLFAQTKFGIKGGVNFANMTSKDEGSSVNSSPSSRLSYNFTGFAEIALNETIFFQPGVSISGKGFKFNESMDFFGTEIKLEGKADLVYLEIPLNAVAKFDAGAGKFFVGAGPYLGYGISGKTKVKGTGIDEEGNFVSESETNDKVFSKGEEGAGLKPLEFGVGFLTGYELNNGLSLNAGYGLGLTNSSRSSESTVKNKVFSISVGFLF